MSNRERVCAWCRREYGGDGVPTRELTDAEYEEFSLDETSSHGCCRQCDERLRKEAARLRRRSPRPFPSPERAIDYIVAPPRYYVAQERQ